MRKLLAFALLAAAVTAVIAMPAAAKPRGVNGKIVVNTDNQVTGQEQVYTVDPDGTNMQLLANDAEAGQWSPDGTRIAIGTESCGGGIINPDSGICTPLHLDTLYPDRFLGCGTWSPDGERLACEGLNFDTDPTLDGIYTVRSSDGGDLQRVTSDPFGDDCQRDYSPNGKQILFTRANESVYGIFTVKVDGTGLRQLTPPGMAFDFCSGDWSPQGNEIVFSAHVPDTERSTIWVVHSDGSGLRKIPVAGCGGVRRLPDRSLNPNAIGCQQPTWSPDGTKIVFGRHFLNPNDYFDLYTVNADGSGLFQVTDTPTIDESGGSWGTHPVTP
jgi:Tol biopolymer transport system component